MLYCDFMIVYDTYDKVIFDFFYLKDIQIKWVFKYKHNKRFQIEIFHTQEWPHKQSKNIPATLNRPLYFKQPHK